MKTVWKVFNIILISILSVLLCFNIYNIGARVLFKQELPKIFGYANAVVVSGSMEPALEIGDMVIIKETNDYQVDDIIIFKDRLLTTHRVIEITESGYRTKGDSNNTADAYIVPFDEVKGEVVKVIKRVGYFVDFLKSPLGMILFIIVGFLIIEVPSWIEKVKRNRENSAK